jgi:hypothetical protein
MVDKTPTNGEAFPEYPRLTSDVKLFITREREYRAWSGRPAALVTIQHELEEALRRVYDDRVGELDPTDPKDQFRAEHLGSTLQLRVTVAGRRGALKRTGDLGAILAETDLREIESIRMYAGGFGDVPEEVDFHLRSKAEWFSSPADYGVELKVAGRDKRWVGGVFENLRSEVERDVPWWSVMRSRPIALGFGLVLAILVGALAARAWPETSGSDDAWLILMAALLLTFAFAVGLDALLKRVFPAFELLESHKSSAVRRYAVLIAGLLGFAASVIAIVQVFV